MSRRAFAIFLSPDATLVVCTRMADQPTEMEQLPAVADDGYDQLTTWGGQISTALFNMGYRGEPVTLGLPSAWTLCANISTEGLPRRQRDQALAYRLEEHLPLPAEECAAAFIHHATPGLALGIAVCKQRIGPVIDILEDQGVMIDHLCPTVFLAAQAATQDSAVPNGFFVISTSTAQDRITYQARLPVDWRYAPADSPMSAVLSGLHQLHTADASHPHLTISGDEAIEQACRMVSRIAQGTPSWINLRSAALAVPDRLRSIRRPVRFAMVAAILGLMALSSAMLYQAQQLNAKGRDLTARQAAVFRDTMPGQRLPVSPKLVLESEARRLTATAGGDGGIPDNGQAVRIFYEMLRRLPTDLRYRVLEIRIDDQRIQVQGEARSHGDVDLIASALRRQHGFDVLPARTERLRDKGVAFTLNASKSINPAIALKEERP